MGHFIFCIFPSVNPAKNTFPPPGAGAPPVVDPTKLSQGIFKMSCPVVVTTHRSHPTAPQRSDSTPLITIDNCAAAVLSLLSPPANETAVQLRVSSAGRVARFSAGSLTRSAMVFLDKPTFLKGGVWSGHTCSQRFSMHRCKTAPSEKGYGPRKESPVIVCDSGSDWSLHLIVVLLFFQHLQGSSCA